MFWETGPYSSLLISWLFSHWGLSRQTARFRPRGREAALWGPGRGTASVRHGAVPSRRTAEASALSRSAGKGLLRAARGFRACFPASPSGDPASPPEEGEAGASALSARRCRKPRLSPGPHRCCRRLGFGPHRCHVAVEGRDGRHAAAPAAAGGRETSSPAFLPRPAVVFKSLCPGSPQRPAPSLSVKSVRDSPLPPGVWTLELQSRGFCLRRCLRGPPGG